VKTYDGIAANGASPIQLPPHDRRQPGPSYLQTNYHDVEATARLLEDNGIDTIVSAMAIESEATSEGQLNLIAAAERSKITTRFIPSEYGLIATPEYATYFPPCSRAPS
jgi:hypothetical protein